MPAALPERAPPPECAPRPTPAAGRRGPLARNKWLLLRRAVQFSTLALFLAGPWLGVWWVKGNLASSSILGTVSLTDPFILAQSMASGHAVESAALSGAAIVFAFYFLVGGRAYCSWVCPINVVTDAAHWLRCRLRLNLNWPIKKSARAWLLATALAVSAAAGVIAWEAVNPITMLQRGLVFGLGMAWAVVAAVFLFDLLITRRGWCGHLCPVGVFYGLIGRFSIVRMNAARRTACTDCGDCFRVCPEPHVIMPALKPEREQDTTVIRHGDCTNCGRCLDVCEAQVFRFSTRFAGRAASGPG